MKKTISILLLICTLILCLVSCGHEHDWVYKTTREPTYTVEGLIYRSCEVCGEAEYYSSIPCISISELIDSVTDAESCLIAAEAYWELPENEKENVYNFYRLKTCMQSFSSDSRICNMLMEIEAEEESNRFHNLLRNKLLNINSYTVNNQTTVVFYDEGTSNYYLYINIDYSAQNQAGGYTRYEKNRECYIWKNNRWQSLVRYTSNVDIKLLEKIYAWHFAEYDRYYFKYNAN